MTSDELYDLFRADVVDVAEPYLWSDHEVYTYMNDAYFMFVRLVGGIPDTLSDACMLEALPKEPLADLHPSILRIRQATLLPTGASIRVINAQDLDSLSEEDWGVLRMVNMNTTIGKIRYMITGLQQDVVRWVHIPDRMYTVQLLVDRLPLKTITGPAQKFEGVQPHHHLSFLKWMRYLAYNKQDAETFNKAKSDTEAAAFQAYCSMAKREKDLYKHKVRVVRYGGL